MDRLIYDENLKKILGIWTGSVKNAKLEQYPFNEIEIIFNTNDVMGNQTVITFKGDRIIGQLGNNRQVIYVTLEDGKIKPIKTTYSTLPKAQGSVMATLLVSVVEMIFVFVANYHLEENAEARKLVKMFTLLTNMEQPVKAKSNSSKSKRISKASNKSNSSKIIDVMAAAKEYTPSTDTGNKQQYNRTCEAWTVKGHYRTYKKTGKIVWVKPTVKGKNKDKIKSKVYKL